MKNPQMYVGDYEVFASYSLLIPPNETLSFSLPFDEEISIKLEIKFNDVFNDILDEKQIEKKEEERELISFSFEKGAMIITFNGWNNPLGMALKKIEPLFSFADGRTVFFLAKNHRIGEINDFAIHFFRLKKESHDK